MNGIQKKWPTWKYKIKTLTGKVHETHVVSFDDFNVSNKGSVYNLSSCLASTVLLPIIPVLRKTFYHLVK